MFLNFFFKQGGGSYASTKGYPPYCCKIRGSHIGMLKSLNADRADSAIRFSY